MNFVTMFHNRRCRITHKAGLVFLLCACSLLFFLLLEWTIVRNLSQVNKIAWHKLTTQSHSKVSVTSPAIVTSMPPVTSTATPCNHSQVENYIQNKTSFLCVRPLGGLGNRLFIYASAYGIATYTNRTLLLKRDDVLEKYFKVAASHVDDKQFECLTKKFKRQKDKFDCRFDPKMLHIPKEKNVCVGTYLQSYKYFEHVADEIKEKFSLQEKVYADAKKIIDESVDVYINKNNETDIPVLVGVHIRRGNFVNHSFGYDVATPQYMKNATSYFRNKYGNVLFLVCSNGMDWAKEHVQGDDVIYIEGHDYITDMAVLVSCNHTISSVGSFSWWVGFLTGGEVVYYQWPAKNGTRLRKQFSNDYSDYFPPSWIGMN